jgi:sarcosine oxidase subunit gamma
MDNLAFQPSLQGGSLSRKYFTVRENTDCGLIRLQTFHRRAGQVDNVSAQLGLALPGPGAALDSGDMQLFWSAPGEWVIVVPRGSERARLMELQAKLDGLFAVLSVMTDSRVTLQLGGAQLRTVLARGSSVDFHPSAFTVGRCLSTRLAGVPVMLVVRPWEEYLLFADRSVAAYLLDWLQAASRDC